MRLSEFLYDFGVVLAVLAVYVSAETLALWLERWAEAAREKRYLNIRWAQKPFRSALSPSARRVW
jgi:hypothetical protein